MMRVRRQLEAVPANVSATTNKPRGATSAESPVELKTSISYLQITFATILLLTILPLYPYSHSNLIYYTLIKMGWLPWSSDDSTKASDGGRIAPDRSSREKCWEGRDLFFSCLDKSNIIDSIKEDKEARRQCGKELAQFEGSCAKAWVKYFKEKRVMEYNRDKTIERIKKEDAAKVADLKAQGWTPR